MIKLQYCTLTVITFFAIIPYVCPAKLPQSIHSVQNLCLLNILYLLNLPVLRARTANAATLFLSCAYFTVLCIPGVGVTRLR